jgi:3-deoxy-D-manno-octulosonic-acid transferase
MNTVLFIIYNIFLYPAFLFIILILSIFNKKIRKGFAGRIGVVKYLKQHFNKNTINNNIIWFHCSSYGEYLQAEPVINNLKIKNKKLKILVSFFSPSGYFNTHNQNIDCKIFMPFDFFWTINSVFNIVNPTAIVLANNDLWFNFLWVAKRRSIKTFLFGAQTKIFFNNKFSFTYYFYKPIYSWFTKIFVINEDDLISIEKYVSFSDTKNIIVTGNPRFDQVINSSGKINAANKVKIEKREDIFILSSMHKEDRNMFLSQTISFMKEFNDIKIIWASHEPSDQENRYLSNVFKRNNLGVKIIKSLNDIDGIGSKVTIVNTVGILSELYWKSKLAYIGGGFSSGVHNLMEPAIAGIPTIFGPNYKKFKEAIEIVGLHAGHSIKKRLDFKNLITSYFCDEKKLINAGKAATEIVIAHSGASKKIVDQILLNKNKII